MSKNVIVVGPPRSGTSLTAGIFARQNYFTGGAAREAVVRGDDYNPFGYFEADDIIERNVSLFQRIGYNCHNTWLFDPISQAKCAKLNRLPPETADREFLGQYARHSPWLWKDPRLCFTLDYWSRVIDTDETVVLLVLRNPTDVYLSFRRKGWAGPGRSAKRKAIERIQQHRDAARASYERFPGEKLAIDYRDFTQQPSAVADGINNLVGLNLTIANLNFHPDLDHSSWRGRAAGLARIAIRSLPRRPIRAIERIVPDRVTRFVFSERKYVSDSR